jgi:hypothetical protein
VIPALSLTAAILTGGADALRLARRDRIDAFDRVSPARL